MMKRTIQFFKHKAYEFRWPLLSGILVGTTYIPFPPWALIFCYAPLWLFAVKENTSLKKSFFAGWLTQFTLTLIGFHWIAHTAHEFGAMNWPVSVLALLLFCAFMHLYIPAAVVLGVLLKKRFALSPIRTLFVIALAHNLLERTWPVIFDWHLGYTLLWAKIPLYHLADLVGFQGLSALILIFNAWLATIWLKSSSLKKALPSIAALLLYFATLTGWGYFKGQTWNRFDNEIKVLAVQANIGNLEKVAAEKGRAYQLDITKKFIDMTLEGLEHFPESDIVVWPETAFPDYLDSYMLYRKAPSLLVENLPRIGRPLITGAYSKQLGGNDILDTSTYNALFLMSAEGKNLSEPYRKTELLAFGEYLPLSETFPIILKWLPFVSNFGRGQGPMTMTWESEKASVNWGSQICYEGLYPGFTRGLAEKGSDILVNVTNDSWFGTPFEPRQHLYMTLARAIEVRRPLIRSTNTGITTGILANGEVLEQSPTHIEWSGMFNIKYLKNAPQTFYVRAGHWDWVLIVATLVVLVLTGARYARSRRP